MVFRSSRVLLTAVVVVVATGILGVRSGVDLAAASGPTPYTGTPFALPGTVTAADFDNGGQGVAYSDTSSGNSGGAYRQSDVDLQRASIGGYNVGWTVPGEWLNYTVTVATAGSYNVTLRAAAISSSSVQVILGGVSGTFVVPNTGGWQTWKTFTVPMTLAAGQQIMTLKIASGEVNVHSVTAAATATPPPTSGPTPYTGMPFALPGTVAAADFDNGGQGVAYSDTSSGNSGGAYRQSDVDLQRASIGGYNVGWTAPGEWLKYTVKVATAGSYHVTLRAAAISSSSVQVTLGGVSGTFAVPNTGGWQAWKTFTVPMTLAAGQQMMTLKIASGEVNVHSVTAAALTPTPTPPPSGGGGSVRILSWNIHHGKHLNGVLDLASQVSLMVSHNPQVILLQELQTWDENQPAKLKVLLEEKTGVPWHVRWAPVTALAGTDGNAVATRLPVVSSQSFLMHATSDWTRIGPNRSVAQATVTVGGVPIHVFSTHLDYDNTSYRTAQLQDMMEWTATFGGKRIVAGDFNAWWGEYWISTMMSEYYDTWVDVTGSNQNGYTLNNAVRFDYQFRSKIGSDKITPTRIYVVSQKMSDHNPVVADYTVIP
jgi:endonuclease/exonuclease/phosphatase family metal-dependent hydrolase